jgi:hypothetical protein
MSEPHRAVPPMVTCCLAPMPGPRDDGSVRWSGNAGRTMARLPLRWCTVPSAAYRPRARGYARPPGLAPAHLVVAYKARSPRYHPRGSVGERWMSPSGSDHCGGRYIRHTGADLCQRRASRCMFGMTATRGCQRPWVPHSVGIWHRARLRPGPGMAQCQDTSNRSGKTVLSVISASAMARARVRGPGARSCFDRLAPTPHGRRRRRCGATRAMT